MIENPRPDDWRALQDGVCQIFKEIGLDAVSEHILSTPRGKVSIDVYAVDQSSVEKIRYLVECKNWKNHIPQSVVHSFTTVMHETGAHIGFIISREGFQAGAAQYLNNTNIVGLTYEQFQARYFPIWWEKQFCANVSAAADSLMQYVEPINTRRERFLKGLDKVKLAKYEELRQRYESFGIVMGMIGVGSITRKYTVEPPLNIEDYKCRIVKVLGEEFEYTSQYYRTLMAEISAQLIAVSEKFHQVFGTNIFAEP